VKRIVILGAFLLLAQGGPAPNPEEVANNVSERIMSPYCDGVTLHDCPSAAADRLRARILDMAEQGATEDVIIRVLEEEFGERIDTVPDNPSAWVVPLMFLMGGIAIVSLLALRWKREGRRPPGEHDPRIPEHEQARVAAMLSEINRRGRW
jgi:cytochrome c-type biogenesis protein CcmH/NrfF